jgi:hypothetical protein
VQIHFERKGGFTGIPLAITINVDALAEPERQVLNGLIDSANFFELPAFIRSSKPLPDRFQYIVGVERGDQKHTVSVDETAAPAPLMALIQALTSATKVQRRI